MKLRVKGREALRASERLERKQLQDVVEFIRERGDLFPPSPDDPWVALEMGGRDAAEWLAQKERDWYWDAIREFFLATVASQGTSYGERARASDVDALEERLERDDPDSPAAWRLRCDIVAALT